MVKQRKKYYVMAQQWKHESTVSIQLYFERLAHKSCRRGNFIGCENDGQATHLFDISRHSHNISHTYPMEFCTMYMGQVCVVFLVFILDYFHYIAPYFAGVHKWYICCCCSLFVLIGCLIYFRYAYQQKKCW